MTALNTLPNELLSLVTNHLEHPRDVLNLSLTSRRLNDFAKLDGWKAFLRGRFGISDRDSDARNTVHGLTTLYRNWNRKGFLARYQEPGLNTTSLNTWERKRWRGPQGQTMGYRPSIDSYEEMLGHWADRKEVLAWSAGTHLVMRVKETGFKARNVWEDKREDDEFDNYKHLNSWYTYQIPESQEGRDDITALKILRPHQKHQTSECVAFGTASGDLTMLEVDLEAKTTKSQYYSTQLREVGALSMSPGSDPFIVATLGDTSLALYSSSLDLPSEQEQQPLSEVIPSVSGARGGRLWSCNFISSDRVAVGSGPTYEPIQIFEITPSGFTPEPLRKFSLDAKMWGGVRHTPVSNTSVYPVVPVSSNSQAGSGAGNIFLSGGYDGIIRLHDMRSPHAFETMFWDVTNDSSIYSLATQGLEHVVAGTSMHSMLKVFDLRFSNSHAYHSISLSTVQSVKRTMRTGDYAGNKIVSEAVNHRGLSPISGGWNVFLHPRNQVRHRTPQFRMPRSEDSPVYSLSIPSQTSSSVYTGVEGAVLGLEFLSVVDKHPDPLFASGIERFPDSNSIDIKQSYNPSNDVLNLGMYEQGNEQALGMRLMVQDGVGMGVVKNMERRDYARFKGLDERWKDPSDDKERWSRGQEPQGRRGGGGRGRRGGRGRGRGW